MPNQISNWALVNANKVVNIIVADQNFINLVKSQYQFTVNLNGLSPSPDIGWSYDGQKFTAPVDTSASDTILDTLTKEAAKIKAQKDLNSALSAQQLSDLVVQAEKATATVGDPDVDSVLNDIINGQSV